MQVGIGKLDNSAVKLSYKCGGSDRGLKKWWVPEDDWITHLEVRRDNTQRVVCGIMFFTYQERTMEFYETKRQMRLKFTETHLNR